MRRSLQILSVLLLGTAGILIARFVIEPVVYSCAHDNRVIAKNSYGDEVFAAEDVCGGIAYSDTVTLALKSKNGVSTKIVSYAPNGAEPSVSWTRPNILVINIAKVGELYSKRERAGDTIIRYKIDRVEIADDHS